MIIEVALFLLFGAIAGAFVVKAYEWRQDVLYGPYIRQNCHSACNIGSDAILVQLLFRAD
jgi:hypothetical protein